MKRHLTAPLIAASLMFCAEASGHDILKRSSGAARTAPEFEAVLASESPQSAAAPVLFSFVAKRLTWAERKELFVCFWNGTASRWQDVLAVAAELTQGLTIRFRGATGPSADACTKENYRQYDIRVSLEPDASLLVDTDDPTAFFSVVGRQSRVDVRMATVNLPFVGETPSSLFRSKVLHEFCHALGCLHEHQRTECASEFDVEAIKANLMLDDKTYREQFESIPSTDPFYRPEQVGDFDRESVMLYTTHEWMFRCPTTARCYRAKDVSALSPGDRKGLAALYSAALATKRQIPGSVAEFDTIATSLEALALSHELSANALRGEARIGVLRNAPAVTHRGVTRAFETQAAKQAAEAWRLRKEAAAYKLGSDTSRRLENALRAYEGR